ncbi:MAG: lipopolysaccharide heptosyltransferase I [Burkholderiales bacterium]|nr:lipopolysaccharide heptosyltransferase I [Burkholderiales bacterium]
MKVLIIRVSSLGDVVHNMPMLQDILQHFPHAIIDWVVEEGYVDLVKLTQGVRRIIPFALRRWRKSLFSSATRCEISQFKQQLQQERYDYIFDTQGLLKTRLIMGWSKTSASGKKYGLGNASEGSGYEPISRFFHDVSVVLPPRTHAVARARLVAASAFGYFPVIEKSLPAANFGLQAWQDEARPAWMPATPYAVFFHGTAGAAKKWPRANWLALAQRLHALGWPILLPWGSAAEEAEAQAMAAALPTGVLQVLPRLAMLDAVRLARSAGLVVGVDTGLTHIAAAYCRPTVEIYSASPRWKTEGNWSEHIINLGDQGQMADVDAVFSAMQKLSSLQQERA